MTDATLIDTTGDDAVDAAVQAVVSAFERALPGRMHAYYVTGSYADHTELTTSDIDICIVVKDRFADDTERGIATTTSMACAAASSYELDIEILEEAALADGLDPALKYGSRCIYGHDIRDTIPALSMEEWARRRMLAACWLTIHVHGRRTPVTLPLTYPELTDTFYGYARRTIRLADGRDAPTTRNLIRTIGWAATALIAYQAGAYVARKSDCHRAYQNYIGGEWSGLLADVYVKCRGTWNYLIPATSRDQAILRDVCRRALGFENHFMTIYTRFLLDELRADSHNRQLDALRFTARTPIQDKAILDAVHVLVDTPDEPIREAASEALAAYGR